MLHFIWVNKNLQISVLGILDQSVKRNYSLEFKPSSSFVAGSQFRNNIIKKTVMVYQSYIDKGGALFSY